MTQTVKRLSAMRETQVPSLCWEGPLEKEMATQSSTLAWKIPCLRSLVGYSHGVAESQTRLSGFTLLQESGKFKHQGIEVKNLRGVWGIFASR